MGCFTSRDKLSPEELRLTEQESELGFGEIKANLADLVLRKYSYHDFINASQLQSSAETLGFVIGNSSSCNQIEAFYARLKKDEGIPLNTLLIVGLFLSEGEPTEKAKLLFEIYDEKQHGELGLLQVTKFVNEMYEVAVNHFPTMIDHSIPEAYDLKVYLEKIECIRTAATLKLAHSITNNGLKVSKDDFIENMESEPLSKLFTTYGFRGYFFEMYVLAGLDFQIEFDRRHTNSLSCRAEALLEEKPIDEQPIPETVLTVNSQAITRDNTAKA